MKPKNPSQLEIEKALARLMVTPTHRLIEATMTSFAEKHEGELGKVCQVIKSRLIEILAMEAASPGAKDLIFASLIARVAAGRRMRISETLKAVASMIAESRQRISPDIASKAPEPSPNAIGWLTGQITHEGDPRLSASRTGPHTQSCPI